MFLHFEESHDDMDYVMPSKGKKAVRGSAFIKGFVIGLPISIVLWAIFVLSFLTLASFLHD